MKNKIFKVGLLAAAVSSALSANFAFSAEDTGIKKMKESDVEVISVTGIRGALVRSQAVKMSSSSIVESISAEDIGKLPDSSIAESLARLPGLSGERKGGRTSGISVRGFKEDFVGTSLNGRELIGIGDNRGVEYDLYPSEIMTGATVYKTTEADLMVQGIGGTVDLETVRPLQAKESITLNASYEKGQNKSQNPEMDNDGHRLAFSIVEKFADETIGLALALATSESPNNQEAFGARYSTTDTGQIVPRNLRSHAISKVLERDTISAVFQYQPNDNLNVIVDFLDIDYSDTGISRGLISNVNLVNVTGEGAYTSGTVNKESPVLRNDPRQKDGELQTFGLNVEYYINDNWSVELDIADSESEKFEMRAESYAGLARSGALSSSELGSRDFKMSPDGVTFSNPVGLEAFEDPALLQLAGPQAWGGGLASLADQFETDVLQANGEPYSFLNAQDGFMNYANYVEELTTAKLEFAGNLDGDFFTGIKFGVNYSERFKSKVNKGFFATAATYPNSGPVPSEYILGTTDLTWAGLGNVVAYDAFAVYDNGEYTLNDAGLLEPDRLGDTFVVNEEVTTLYLKADFETEIGDMALTGNFGIQYVDTAQSSSGTIGVVGANFKVCDSDDNDVVDQACLVEGGADYNHVLPSVNLSLEVAENQFVRFAANKTISRARIDQMKASGFVKFAQNINTITIPNTEAAVNNYGSPWSKETGNPELEPLESNNLDISYENYFSDEGYVSVAVFYKDIVNWTSEGDQLINFRNDPTNDGADYFVPGFHDIVIPEDGTYGPAAVYFEQGDLATPPDLGTFSAFEDGLEGSMKGVELTANIPFNTIADALDGFGLAASHTYIDAELEDGSVIPGQSDNTTSATVYYQADGFEFRIAATKRSDFATYERGGSNKIDSATRLGVTLVDAQISYDFDESGIDALQGLRISFSGTNLTDEEEETIDDDRGVVGGRSTFGSSYVLNMNYSF